MKIVFFGAGAIGQSVGAWVSEHHPDVFFADRGKVARTMKEKGVTLYLKDADETRRHFPMRVIENLAALKDADVIVIGVKNFNIHEVCKMIKNETGDRPLIIAMQNGVENQSIVPRYFSKVIFCVIGYNAWFDEPGVLGYQKKGPLVFGTLHNELTEEMNMVAAIFNKGVETVVVDHLQDAVHSKLIINLTNSVTTLVGLGFREISDMRLFQKLLTNLLYEGTKIARAAGYKECKIGGMPPWILMQAGATLPQFLTRGMFRNNVKKMVISSMAQDIIQRGGSESELETINGYFVRLAEKHGVKAPYNNAVYKLCLREFSKPGFKPLDVKDVWNEVSKDL